MNFEWDPKKSNFNKKKHGVSFSQATAIWQGVHINLNNIAKSSEGESRSATLGLIGGKVYTAIWTKRNERIRIISVRRARNGEEKVFWQKTI